MRVFGFTGLDFTFTRAVWWIRDFYLIYFKFRWKFVKKITKNLFYKRKLRFFTQNFIIRMHNWFFKNSVQKLKSESFTLKVIKKIFDATYGLLGSTQDILWLRKTFPSFPNLSSAWFSQTWHFYKLHNIRRHLRQSLINQQENKIQVHSFLVSKYQKIFAFIYYSKKYQIMSTK